MARTRDLFALILADRQRMLLALLGGWSIFLLVLFLGLNYLGCRGCPPGTVPGHISQKVLLFSIVYALGPWVFSVHSVHHGTEVLSALPLSPTGINLFMVLRGLILGVLCIPACYLVLHLFPRYGMEVFPWVVTAAVASVFVYQLVGMVAGTFVRLALYAIFPLVVFPPLPRHIVAGPLGFIASPWATLIVLGLAAALLPLVLRRPLPASKGSGRWSG